MENKYTDLVEFVGAATALKITLATKECIREAAEKGYPIHVGCSLSQDGLRICVLYRNSVLGLHEVFREIFGIMPIGKNKSLDIALYRASCWITEIFKQAA